MDYKTCKECPNYGGIIERKGEILIKCKVLGEVHIKKMADCKFTDAKVCVGCGRIVYSPCFWKGEIYCADCFHSFI